MKTALNWWIISQVTFKPCELFHLAYKSSEEATYIKHAERMKRQRMMALGEAPLEATYDHNPRIQQNQEIFSLPDSDETRSRHARRKQQPQPKVKFNQDFFSAKAHQKAKSKKRWKMPPWGSHVSKINKLRVIGE